MKKIMFNDRYGLTQAVIEGRKTMTRRIIGGYPLLPGDRIDEARFFAGFIQIVANDGETLLEVKSRYKVGEVVAVAQSYRDVCAGGFEPDAAILRLFEEQRIAGWTNKIFVKPNLMPHQIRITGVHCERLQDISDEDCLREGIFIEEYFDNGEKHQLYCFDPFIDEDDDEDADGWFKFYNNPRTAFADLIDEVSGKGTWKRNPWVIAYEFELVKQQDSMPILKSLATSTTTPN